MLPKDKQTLLTVILADGINLGLTPMAEACPGISLNQLPWTDTEGFTDHVFALCHLLRFRFAPRIRDIGDKRLHTAGDKKSWPELASLFGDRLKVKKIETQ
jgi:hypothetical protein